MKIIFFIFSLSLINISCAAQDVKSHDKSVQAADSMIEKIAPYNPEDVKQIEDLCVKNSKLKHKSLKAICECSVRRSFDFIYSNNFEDKNPKKRLEWLKKMYELKLSQKEVDEDIHGILEFNIPITTECMAEQKSKK